MDKQLRFRWKIVIDYVVQLWYIDTTSCNVGNDQNLHFSGTEFGGVDFSRRRIQIGINVRVTNSSMIQNLNKTH